MPDLVLHSPSPPFAHTSGTKSARITFVGEAWGETEDRFLKPFVGESGKEFFRMLGEAWDLEPGLHASIRNSMYNDSVWLSLREEWFERVSVLLTNVLAFRPPNNKLEALCAPKKEVGPGYNLPALKPPGGYLRTEFLPELSRLQQELAFIKPNLVIALGGSATWALLRTTKIGSVRGTITESTLVPGLKVLPTYHPAGVLRNWAWRPIVIADLMKGLRESKFAEIRRPERWVLISPTLQEVIDWVAEVCCNPPRYLSVDIETKNRQITHFGFARSKSSALVIPFVDKTKPNNCYWSFEEELLVWQQIKLLMESTIPKLGQNFLYDLQYIARMGIRPRACDNDTMLFHHAVFPELQKGLGFLGSIYTNEASWKLNHRSDSTKKDE